MINIYIINSNLRYIQKKNRVYIKTERKAISDFPGTIVESPPSVTPFLFVAKNVVFEFSEKMSNFYSCCVNTGKNDRFQHKKCIKTQNFKSSKIDINHLQDLKNVRKIIFNHSGTNLVQNCI